jgi:hypothetical protein
MPTRWPGLADAIPAPGAAGRGGSNKPGRTPNLLELSMIHCRAFPINNAKFRGKRDHLLRCAAGPAHLHLAQTIAITGRSYRLKDHAAIAGKEDKNKKGKSKPHDPGCAGDSAEARPSTAEPAS